MKSAASPTCCRSVADLNQATNPRTGWLRSARFANAIVSTAHSVRSLKPPGGRAPAAGSRRACALQSTLPCRWLFHSNLRSELGSPECQTPYPCCSGCLYPRFLKKYIGVLPHGADWSFCLAPRIGVEHLFVRSWPCSPLL